MSYLLEALQKSQKEREQNVPGIQTPALQVEVPDEAPRSPWIYIAIAALAINTVLIAYLLWRPTEPVVVASSESVEAPKPAAATAIASPVLAPTISAADRVQVRDLDATPSEVAPTDATPRIVTHDRDTFAASTMPTVITADTENAGKEASAPASTNNSDQVIDVDLFSVPTVNQLADDIRQQLPALEMNSHIYAPTEKDSFVMINGISLTPGMMLMPNLKLLAITADGAVLQFNEHKFLLPALSSFKP